MKKALISLLIILVVVAIISVIFISNNYKTTIEIKKINQEYEIYLNKELFGTDVTTIINKAANSNEKNGIPKDEKGFFIENDTNSIKVEIIMLDEGNSTTYQMETIQKVGINRFIDNFNLINFKCTKIEYHSKTNLVSKIVFEQIEE